MATLFIRMVSTFDPVKKAFTNEAHACQIMHWMVESAGFPAVGIVPGLLRGDYLDQSENPTGETYEINQFPYIVVFKGDDGKKFGDIGATTWLDLQYYRVKHGWTDQTEGQKIIRLAEMIERSRPMVPIVITREGDQLIEYPPGSVHAAHTRNGMVLARAVGLHAICGGRMDREHATPTHDVIRCGRCYLRIPFLKEVATYGDLRKHLSTFN